MKVLVDPLNQLKIAQASHANKKCDQFSCGVHNTVCVKNMTSKGLCSLKIQKGDG
jgi:hypothetical protein